MKIKVHSSDPIKKYVVALMKKKANCVKITSIIKHKSLPNTNDGGFYGQAFVRIYNSKSYLGLGSFFVSEQELHQEYPNIFFDPKTLSTRNPSLVDKYNVSGDLFIKIPNQGIVETTSVSTKTQPKQSPQDVVAENQR